MLYIRRTTCERENFGGQRRRRHTGGEYNRTWDQWLMGRLVLEKPAPVRRTMGQNDEDSIIIFFKFTRPVQ